MSAALAKVQNQNRELLLLLVEDVEVLASKQSDRDLSQFNRCVAIAMEVDKLSGTPACELASTIILTFL